MHCFTKSFTQLWFGALSFKKNGVDEFDFKKSFTLKNLKDKAISLAFEENVQPI